MLILYPPIVFLPFLRQGLWMFFFLLLLISPASAYAPPYGTITGRVTNAQGEPMSAVVVPYHFSLYWNAGTRVETDANGIYTMSLYPQTYRLIIMPHDPNYVREYYSDKSTVQTADDIVIEPGAVITGYDVVLANAGRVFGTVMDANGTGLANVKVQAIRDDGVMGPAVGIERVTNELGKFDMPLPATGYRLYFNAQSSNYVNEYYNDKFIYWYKGDSVDIPADQAITITVQLDPPPSITGRVVDNQGVPISGLGVALIDGGSSGWSSSYTTNENGYYSIPNLQTKRYTLFFNGYIANAEYYSEKSSLGTADWIDFTQSVAPVVANATLTRFGMVTGRVTNLEGEPLEGVRVAFLYRSNRWSTSNVGRSDSNGYYLVYISPLRVNRVEFSKADYVTVYYDSATTIDNATPITVPLETTIPNINAAMRLVTQPDLQIERNNGGDGIENPYAVGQTVYFSATSPYSSATYLWDFGDNASVAALEITAGQYVQHAYNVAGAYAVTLTASNGVSKLITLTQFVVGTTPTAEPTVEEPPVEEPTIEDTPTPTAEPTVEEPPVEEPIIEDTPTPTAETTVEEPPVEEPAVEDTPTPTVETTVEEPPMEEPTIEETPTPTAETTVEEPSVEEPTIEETPTPTAVTTVEAPPVEEPTIEDTPTPTAEMTVEEPPIEEPMVEDTSTPTAEPTVEKPPMEEPVIEETPIPTAEATVEEPPVEEPAIAETPTPTAEPTVEEPSVEEPAVEKTLTPPKNPTHSEPSVEQPVTSLILQGPPIAHHGFAITLAATVETGGNVSYVWDFGDGNSGVGEIVHHTYIAPGTYTITLRASNSQGEQVATRQMVVQHGVLLPSIVK